MSEPAWLDRFRKLVALAAKPQANGGRRTQEEEARTAAIQACELLYDAFGGKLDVIAIGRAETRRPLTEILERHRVTREVAMRLPEERRRCFKCTGPFRTLEQVLVYTPPARDLMTVESAFPKPVATHDTDECREWWRTYEF